VVGNSAEGVFRRQKRSVVADNAIEWLCCGLSSPLEVLPSQAVSVHRAAPVGLPSIRATWCGPSESLGRDRTGEHFECKANFALLSTLGTASTGVKIFEAIPKQDCLESFRYEDAHILGTGIIMPGES